MYTYHAKIYNDRRDEDEDHIEVGTCNLEMRKFKKDII